VPGISFTSDNCLVRISEADEDRKPTNTSDAEFTIISPEIDSLTLVSPNGREVLTAGSGHDITWTSTGTVGANVRMLGDQPVNLQRCIEMLKCLHS
jgi:hypothetical protein